MHQESACPPVSNTGVPHENRQPAHDVGIAEYQELLDRGWPAQAIGSSCPVSGRVVRFDGSCILMTPNYLEDLQKQLQEIFNDNYAFSFADFGSQWYKVRYEWLYGISIHAQPRVEGSNNDLIKCDLLGAASSQLELKQWAELFLWVEERGGHVSSLQLNVDDFKHEVTPLQMLQAVEQPGEKNNKKVSKGILGFGTAKFMKSYSLSGGTSMTFGKRGSKGGGKQYCCYDKNAESQGAINCIRHELRLYDHKAKEVFAQLCETAKFIDGVEELWPELISGVVFGAIDFRDVSGYIPGENKIKDCPRFEWWEKFVTNSSIIKLAGKKKIVPTFDRAVRYIRRQVAPIFATVANCYAQLKDDGTSFWKFIYETIDLGEENMNKHQRRIVAEHKSIHCET